MNRIASPQGWQGETLNRVLLPQNWQEHCSNLPESGMGYQKVNCKVAQGPLGSEKVVSAIVLNGQFMESVDKIQPENILDISII